MEAEVLVVEDLAKDCLMGMDVLESCPVTSGPMVQLREALDPNWEHKKAKVSNKEWYQVCESPAKEFFDGIQGQIDKRRRLEEQEREEKRLFRVCAVDLVHKSALENKISGIELEMSKLRSEITETAQYIEINHVMLQETAREPTEISASDFDRVE